jgi:hypothetical protein
VTLQSGFTFQLWDEMREHAQRTAQSAIPLPTVAECAAWLQTAMIRHFVELPKTVLDFYSAELCSMIQELRDERVNQR